LLLLVKRIDTGDGDYSFITSEQTAIGELEQEIGRMFDELIAKADALAESYNRYAELWQVRCHFRLSFSPLAKLFTVRRNK
jgi:hypothetical protein